MATLAKTYGVTLLVATGVVEYSGADNYMFFGGGNDRIAMFKFNAPAEMGASEFLSAAVLRAQMRGENYGDADNITIGLISGSWAGNTSGGYAALKGYCSGPTVSRYLSTTTTLSEKTLYVQELLSIWAANPSAYSGLYLRCELLYMARISPDNCDITTTIMERTAPGSPTSASLSASLAENDPTLSYSGATHGINNNIFGYEINYSDSVNGVDWGAWTYLKSVNNTLMYGSTTVALPSTRGRYRKYRIKSLGEYEIDSAWVETAAVRKNSSPAAPASLTVSPAIYESGTVLVVWPSAIDPDGNVQYYELQWATSSDGVTYGSWNDSGNIYATQFSYTSGISRGHYEKLRVRAVDAFGVKSDYVESNAMRKNSLPSAPAINLP